MENPFLFGKAVNGQYFTDRQEDSRRLEANLTHGINTILISPRRWGKTSLVKKVIASIDTQNTKVVFLDVYHCKSEYEFYRSFASAVIKQTSSRLDECLEMARGFLANISPKFSFGPDPMTDFSLSFEWDPKAHSEETILSLPEKIAAKKGIHVIVCLDEFQQVAEVGDHITLQKKLRGVWQHQQHVTYCLFGSKKHLMENMFANKSMPFYRFGDIMFLKKIPTQEWVQFICSKFEETGKSITQTQAALICDLTENLSAYVQHLSWIVWYKTHDNVTHEIITAALNDMMEQCQAFLENDIEDLTELQLNFLKAIAHGVTSGLSTKEVIAQYRLVSSANVASIKRGLIKKGLIYTDGPRIELEDSLLKLYIKNLI